jgi:hypothetical protein
MFNMRILTLDDERKIWTQAFLGFSENHFVFVLPAANILGDAYLALGFAKAFEASRGLEVVVAASANHSSHRKAIHLYNIPAHKVAYLDNDSFRFVTSVYTNGPFYRYLNGYPEKQMSASRIGKVIHPGFGSSDIDWAAKGIQLFDLYRILLGIGPRALFHHHENSVHHVLQANALFAELKLRKGKTVVVFPDAFSLSGIKKDVFLSIIKEFQICGFDVLVDSKDEEFSDIALRTFIDLPLIVPFLNLCGFSVINRSGMADITLKSTAKKWILYPNKLLQSVYSNSKEGENIVDVTASNSQEWSDIFQKIAFIEHKSCLDRQ